MKVRDLETVSLSQREVAHPDGWLGRAGDPGAISDRAWNQEAPYRDHDNFDVDQDERATGPDIFSDEWPDKELRLNRHPSVAGPTLPATPALPRGTCTPGSNHANPDGEPSAPSGRVPHL